MKAGYGEEEGRSGCKQDSQRDNILKMTNGSCRQESESGIIIKNVG